MIKQPAISVVMPAYNAEKYIDAAISSVLAQSFTNFELLVINDGSTDATGQIIRQFDDPRVRLIEQPNQGIAAALNNGLAAARASLIARFDADDICLPNRLKVQHDFITAHPEYIIIGTAADFIDRDDRYVFTYQPALYSNEEIQASDKSKCPFIHSSVLYRKEPVLLAGGYNVHAYAFEDHLLWLKVLTQGKACNTPEVLLKVRLNPESVTVDERWYHKRFIQIKNNALREGKIDEVMGNELKDILKGQASCKIKEGAYYSLLGKKYLWNNYQPAMARTNLRKTLSIQPADLSTWCLLLLSYMPAPFIQRVYAWRAPFK